MEEPPSRNGNGGEATRHGDEGETKELEIAEEMNGNGGQAPPRHGDEGAEPEITDSDEGFFDSFESRINKLLKESDCLGEEEFKPKNSVTLSLDGSSEEVFNNYIKAVKHIRHWNYSRGIRVKFGNKIFYTTPETGTFYVKLQYESETVVLVIQGRHGWLKGYVTDHKAFELKPDEGQNPYMLSRNSKILSFKGNHQFISGGDPSSTQIGLHVLRKLMQEAAEYKGNKEPQMLRNFFSACTIYFCEAPKIDPVFIAACESFINENISRLNRKRPCMNELIKNWSTSSQWIMTYIENVSEGTIQENNSSSTVADQEIFDELSKVVKILHIDAFAKGPFKHKEPRPQDIWEPIDEDHGGANELTVAGIPNSKNKKEKFNALFQKRAGGPPTQMGCLAVKHHIRKFCTKAPQVQNISGPPTSATGPLTSATKYMKTSMCTEKETPKETECFKIADCAPEAYINRSPFKQWNNMRPFNFATAKTSGSMIAHWRQFSGPKTFPTAQRKLTNYVTKMTLDSVIDGPHPFAGPKTFPTLHYSNMNLYNCATKKTFGSMIAGRSQLAAPNSSTILPFSSNFRKLRKKPKEVTASSILNPGWAARGLGLAAKMLRNIIR